MFVLSNGKCKFFISVYSYIVLRNMNDLNYDCNATETIGNV